MHPEIFTLVNDEATNLLQFATKEELRKLDFERLDPTHRYLCIYGQMTGNCDNSRSIELIHASAARVFNADDNPQLSHRLNGSPKGSLRIHYWSPIEVFIAQPENQTNGNNEQLVRFLKGKRKTLKFVK